MEIEVTRKQNIVFQYLVWHFWEVPKTIFNVWKNFIRFYFNFFSIPLLVKTFFSPWRGYRWHYGRGFDLGKYLEALVSNLICRFLGALLRFFLILIGILVEVGVIIVGFILFLGWLTLPILLIFGLYHGFRIFF